MRILIFGAGRVGLNLAKFLEKKHEVIVLDRDKDVCDRIASESDLQVICGDTTDPDRLDQLKLGTADFVFAVTGHEEANFLVSLYAKHARAKRVVCRASEAKYSRLMERLEVEPLLPESTLARELANMVMHPVISQLLDPRFSQIEMLEKEVTGGMVNKSVAEASESQKFTIAAVYDGRDFQPAEPSFILQKGMKIVVVKHNRK
ncbi:TrkA family potassium uptake protein [Candidatus Micrarchaeota archaeon]|nr:TrkA family potassium uptake protein [Candidatus Micrarchaeota archaeon]